jgi:hypothetical protein
MWGGEEFEEHEVDVVFVQQFHGAGRVVGVMDFEAGECFTEPEGVVGVAEEEDFVAFGVVEERRDVVGHVVGFDFEVERVELFEGCLEFCFPEEEEFEEFVFEKEFGACAYRACVGVSAFGEEEYGGEEAVGGDFEVVLFLEETGESLEFGQADVLEVVCAEVVEHDGVAGGHAGAYGGGEVGLEGLGMGVGFEGVEYGLRGQCGVRGFETKGIENPMADEDIVYADNVIGRVIYHTAAIGVFLSYIKAHIVMVAALLIGVLILCIALRVLFSEGKRAPLRGAKRHGSAYGASHTSVIARRRSRHGFAYGVSAYPEIGTSSETTQ